MNIPWKLPFSRSFASSTQCFTLLKPEDLSSGCDHNPGDWWPLQDSTNALRMSCFFGAIMNVAVVKELCDDVLEVCARASFARHSLHNQYRTYLQSVIVSEYTAV